MAVLIEPKIVLQNPNTTALAHYDVMDSPETLAQPPVNRQVAVMNKARASGSIDTFELTCLLWGG